MSRWSSFASFLMACLLTAIFLGIPVPVAYGASAGSPFLELGKSPTGDVVEIKDRGRGARIYLPIAPSYLYYDYPYYYSRGYYPTHVGPGFIYYGYPYYRYKSRGYRKLYGRPCSYRPRRCVANNRLGRAPASARHKGVCGCL